MRGNEGRRGWWRRTQPSMLGDKREDVNWGKGGGGGHGNPCWEINERIRRGTRQGADIATDVGRHMTGSEGRQGRKRRT